MLPWRNPPKAVQQASVTPLQGPIAGQGLNSCQPADIEACQFPQLCPGIRGKLASKQRAPAILKGVEAAQQLGHETRVSSLQVLKLHRTAFLGSIGSAHTSEVFLQQLCIAALSRPKLRPVPIPDSTDEGVTRYILIGHAT